MSEFEPKIVGFLCNWCSYAGADKAGAEQIAFPPNVHVVRVMCSGRVDGQAVLDAFAQGADGVLALGCLPRDCHYKDQNYKALQRVEVLAHLLKATGFDSRRLRFEFVPASGSAKYRQVISEMTMAVKQAGPIGGT